MLRSELGLRFSLRERWDEPEFEEGACDILDDPLLLGGSRGLLELLARREEEEELEV